MPLKPSAWNTIQELQPGQPKNAAPLGQKLGSLKTLQDLIDAGHLSWDGGRVVREATSVDAVSLFDSLPVDGSALSNMRARQVAQLSERRYQFARALLLRTGEIALGRGRGGTVRRMADVDLGQRVGAALRESDLYVPFRDWLETGGQHEAQSMWLCKVTAHGSGQRRGTGQWTRPDVVTLSVTDFAMLPSIDVEVRSYELKPYVQARNLVGVYGASAHQRRVHYSSLVLEWPLNGEIVVPGPIQEECSRLGVGLSIMWAGEVEPILEPERHDPQPAELNDFISDIVSNPADRSTYLAAIGRSAEIPGNGRGDPSDG